MKSDSRLRWSWLITLIKGSKTDYGSITLRSYYAITDVKDRQICPRIECVLSGIPLFHNPKEFDNIYLRDKLLRVRLNWIPVSAKEIPMKTRIRFRRSRRSRNIKVLPESSRAEGFLKHDSLSFVNIFWILLMFSSNLPLYDLKNFNKPSKYRQTSCK